MKKVVLENIVKNIILVSILVPAYFQIKSSFEITNLSESSVGSLLVAVSILAVTACFGNFAFTYEHVRLRNFSSRLISHLTTGLLMLLIGLSLEMTAVLASLLVNNFQVFNFSLLILYLASILYDFWDLERS